MIDSPEMRQVAADAGLPWVRGGTTGHGAGQHPISEAVNYGRGEHQLPSMQDSALRRRLWAFTTQGEDLPQATNRVELDGTVKDAWGFPAGRVTYVPHRHELVASAYAADLHERVMREAGAGAAFSATSPRGDEPPESRHVMGTARMGTDPAQSVVSPAQHLWDVDNVFVCDSSVFPTSSGYNPTLTLAALSHRAASKMVGHD
jgi:choline dehydrogenase-like flavoprotein